MGTPLEAIRREPIARLEAVEKSYGGVQALAGIDLEIRRGEVLAVLGPNGAGKTTAVSLLLGLLQPDVGRATLWGQDPRQLAVRCRLGAMLQNSGLAETLRVEEQLDLYRSYYPNPAPVEFLIETAGLGELMRRRVDAMSGGQRQRLLFALALAGNPELLFLDEPSAGLDLESRRRLWERIRNLTDAGRTVLLTTHHLEEAAALADRVVVLMQGRVIAEGTPTELEATVAGRCIRCTTALDVATVRALPGVTGVEQRGRSLEIQAVQAETVVQSLLGLDPGLRDLNVSGMGLEQAFLALTQGQGEPSQSSSDLASKERAA